MTSTGLGVVGQGRLAGGGFSFLILILLMASSLSFPWQAVAEAAPSSKSSAASVSKTPPATSSNDLLLVPPPPSFWFPDWTVPDFDFALQPLLGVSYETARLTRSVADPSAASGVSTVTSDRQQVTLEGGARLTLQDIPLFRGDREIPSEGRETRGEASRRRSPHAALSEPQSPLAITLSPHIGYALGHVSQLEIKDPAAERLGLESVPSRSGFYHRALAGTDVTTYYRYFRYRIGVDYARLFGTTSIVEPRSQGELSQDFGIRVLPSVSFHLTPTVGRVFSKSLADHTFQYVDVWLHMRWSLGQSALVDLGPGQGFDWYPQADFGTQAFYVKANFDWEIFGPLAVALRARYEVDVQHSESTVVRAAEGSDGDSQQTRAPLSDLGMPATQRLRSNDDLSLMVFAGLRNIVAGVSVGYLAIYEYENALERAGKRSVTSSQGLGVQASLAL